MTALTPSDLDEVVIEDLIFHVVGAGEDVLAVDQVNYRPFVDFFVGLIRAAVRGPRLQFTGTGLVVPQLKDLKDNRSTFAEAALNLAKEFHAMHEDRRFSTGAFVCARGKAGRRDFFALLKYDNLKILNIKIDEEGGKTVAKISEGKHNLTQELSALQKAALICDLKRGAELRAYDRTNKSEITQYFRTFLGAKLLLDELDSSKKFKKCIEKICGDLDLGSAERKLVMRRVQDVATTSAEIDLADIDSLCPRIFGSDRDNSDLHKKMEAEFERLQIDKHTFKPDRRVLTQVRYTEITSNEGALLRFPKHIEDESVKIEEHGGGRATVTLELTGVKTRVVDDEPLSAPSRSS